MQVLPLLHVDTSDLVALLLLLPRTAPDVCTAACFYIEFLALVKADALRVCFDVVQLIALG